MFRRDIRISSAAIAAVAVVASIAAASANAASLVYSKGGKVYLAHVDGSHAVVVKKGGYFWPSMDDNGIIAAEKQDAPAPAGTTGYTIHRFKQNGKKLPGHVATPSAFSSIACPAFPSYHVSLSPNGTKVAYDYADCNGVNATWTGSSGAMNLHDFPDYFAPAWRSSSQLVVSHYGQTFTPTQAEVGLLGTGGGTAGWSTDLADSWATGYHATATRDGKKIALIEDDAADQITGMPTRVTLVLGTAGGPGQAITRQCSVSLPADQYGNWQGTTFSNLSFSPDGNFLAWDAQNGIWKGTTKELAGCTAQSVNKKLWINGAINPSFSPAADTR